MNTKKLTKKDTKLMIRILIRYMVALAVPACGKMVITNLWNNTMFFWKISGKSTASHYRAAQSPICH